MVHRIECEGCKTMYPLPDNVPGSGIVVIKCYTCDAKLTITPRKGFFGYFPRVKYVPARK